MNKLYQRNRPACLDKKWESGAGLIWMTGETLFFENPRNRVMCFRRRFSLPFVPLSAEVRIFADTHYNLFVNGSYCGLGPSRSDPTWTYYDLIDVRSVLRKGENVVAAQVLFQGFGTGARISIMQGLLLQLVVKGTNGQEFVVVSDQSWVASPAEEFVRPTPRLHGPLGCVEVQDTRLVEQGWECLDFDDSSWLATDYVKADLSVTPWYHFVENPCPRRVSGRAEFGNSVRVRIADTVPPDVSELGAPRAFPSDVAASCHAFPVVLGARPDERTAHVVTMDLARIENGLLRLDVSGARGVIIDALFSDSIAMGDIVPKPEQARILTERWILRGGRQTLEVAFNWLAFRHVQLWVWSTEVVVLHRAWVSTLYYPLPEVEGFTCDNDFLNRLDEICTHTVRLCYQDGIVDSPSREQQQWIGDARKTAIFNHHRWGDTAMHRNLIEQIGQGMDWMGSMVPRYPSGNRNVSPIPSYCLDWICAFGDYRWYTGDDSLIAAWWPNILLAIRWFSAFEREDGLLSRVPHWVYIDLGEDLEGHGMGTGEELAALNLQYLAALRAVADYAELLGDNQSCAWFAEKQLRLAQSIRDVFWNPSTECYSDALDFGRLTRGVSEVTTALALVHLEERCSIRAEGLISRVFVDPQHTVVRCSPFSMHLVLEALHRHGRDQLALELIRTRYRPLIEAGATATWEHWQVQFSDSDSDYPKCASSCHAWGAAPMAFFVGVVLGIQPASPGWNSIRVRISPCGLRRASGACLTPYGKLSVAWEFVGDTLIINMDVPSGAKGEVVTPSGKVFPLRSGISSESMDTPSECPANAHPSTSICR